MLEKFVRKCRFSLGGGFFTGMSNTLCSMGTKLKDILRERGRFGNIVGESRAMRQIYEMIPDVATSDTNIVIYGESGTGKELIAGTIHDVSARYRNAFVPVNCGAIPEPLFESEFFGYRKGAFTGANTDRPGFLCHSKNVTVGSLCRHLRML